MTPCRPHVWRTPSPGDTRLTCDSCGRLLPLLELEKQHVRYNVLRAYAKRCGMTAGREFASALADALNNAQIQRHAGRGGTGDSF